MRISSTTLKFALGVIIPNFDSEKQTYYKGLTRFSEVAEIYI